VFVKFESIKQSRYDDRKRCMGKRRRMHVYSLQVMRLREILIGEEKRKVLLRKKKGKKCS